MKGWHEAWLTVGMIGMAAVFGAIGCERRPAPPPPATSPAEVKIAEEPQRPTTQELLSGPYRRLVLPAMPLSLEVPQSWKLTFAGQLSMLEGPTPTREAALQFAQRDVVRQDRFNAFVERLKQEVTDSSPLKLVDMRKLGNAQVLERRWTDRPVSMPQQNFRGEPVADAQGNPVMITTTPLHWTLTVFVPTGEAYSRYELNWIALTAEQYNDDKELLEKIVRSLSYDETATTAPSTSAPSITPPMPMPMAPPVR